MILTFFSRKHRNFLINIDITALFCCLDDFATFYQTWQKHLLIPKEGKRCRSSKLCLSEMLFIIVPFHSPQFRSFKYFYLYGVCLKCRDCFGSLPHYARFVPLMPHLLTPLVLISQSLRGQKTGVYFVDSTILKVCHRRRTLRNKVFDDLAKHGRASMGWFFGLKLHRIVNHKGHLMAIQITPGNTGDRAALDTLTKQLIGKLYADKGYLGKALFKRLWDKGVQLVTGIRKNMKNYFMPL